MPQIKTHIYHDNWREWKGIRINPNLNPTNVLDWLEKHLEEDFVIIEAWHPVFRNVVPVVVILENSKDAVRFKLIWG